MNREKGTLSKMFQVLVELRFLEGNPCRMVKNLSQKSEERQVYLARDDVERILGRLPAWAQPIVLTAFYTGMRRCEISSLKRKQVDLAQRMIYLGPQETKEGHWKRVPIHRELGRILESIMKVQSLGHEEIFLVDGNPPYPTSVSKPWRHAVMELSLEPAPRSTISVTRGRPMPEGPAWTRKSGSLSWGTGTGAEMSMSGMAGSVMKSWSRPSTR